MHALRLLAAFVMGHLSLVVSSPAAPERIVTLGASVTETVFALGAGGAVVARDMSSVYPAEVAALPDVGYFRTIGAEGVLSQHPTLVLAAHGTGPASQVEILQKSGVRFVHLDARPSAESALSMIAEVGKQTGREAEAAALAGTLRARFAEAAALAAQSGRKPRAVFLMGINGSALQAAYDDTAAGALIALAGGENLLSGLPGYKSVTPESVLALDPDFILYATRGGAATLTPESAPAWLKTTRAMREGHVFGLEMTWHLVFGPRLGDAVLDLAQKLHAAPAVQHGKETAHAP